ncbi:hypothetical protein AOQ84DRAFT_382569 [Glonium stellatum]|uniref:Clr5 domain-containing protein n=1 Tax=Glonium stellatum TaxID=574774 RepID=A0A8E2JME0_9PEZI|nr:hypothetical protein AOQ84DRAFT_382569 [Glonium stellatum]
MRKQWSDVKEEIRKLNKTENKTLNEVMRLMRRNHGFHASSKVYVPTGPSSKNGGI